LLFSDPASASLLYSAASSLGSTPGIQLGARNLPLNPDPLMNITIGGLPPLLTGYAGLLDAAAPFGFKTISNAHETLVQ